MRPTCSNVGRIVCRFELKFSGWCLPVYFVLFNSAIQVRGNRILQASFESDDYAGSKLAFILSMCQYVKWYSLHLARLTKTSMILCRIRAPAQIGVTPKCPIVITTKNPFGSGSRRRYGNPVWLYHGYHTPAPIVSRSRSMVTGTLSSLWPSVETA